ncbi:hypothetical protein [Streptomyces sp. NPDC002328]|uniref:hypothetical protein n=1 Tax=Streptomyces sp. NPDC002328 TaxID=3364642 RepID=UPI00368F2989
MTTDGEADGSGDGSGDRAGGAGGADEGPVRFAERAGRPAPKLSTARESSGPEAAARAPVALDEAASPARGSFRPEAAARAPVALDEAAARAPVVPGEAAGRAPVAVALVQVVERVREVQARHRRDRRGRDP